MNHNTLQFWHFGRPTISGMEALAQRSEALGYDGSGAMMTQCVERRL